MIYCLQIYIIYLVICVFAHCYTRGDDLECPMDYGLSLLPKVFPYDTCAFQYGLAMLSTHVILSKGLIWSQYNSHVLYRYVFYCGRNRFVNKIIGSGASFLKKHLYNKRLIIFSYFKFLKWLK